MNVEPGMQSGTNLDLNHLCEISGNDTVTMCEVIDVFLEHAPTLMRELQDHCHSRDGNALRRAAHKLKPMLAYVGMTSIHMRAAQIEQLEPGAESWEETSRLVRAIMAEFEPARQELMAYRATLTTQS